jgi:hypothetical protein
MSGTPIEQRIAQLETSLRRMRFAAAAAGMLAVTGLLAIGMVDDQPRKPDQITAAKLTIVDEKGRPRVVISEDPTDTQRRSRSAGITIYDDQGSERGGFGTMADGSVVFAMDAPAGVGSPMRDRLGLYVGKAGQAHIMLIDNETRGVAKLYSDGSGGGGVQVFKWHDDAKKVDIKTFTFEGEKIDTMKLN